MLRFEILFGLPPYGPMAFPFPSDGRGAFREGLVVRFHPVCSEAWVGNFQRGLTKYDVVLEHPDQRQAVVIAGGSGYVVDPELRKETHHMSDAINYAVSLQDLGEIVVGNDLEFGAIRADGTGWNTPRISWDGIRNISISGSTLTGEAYSPLGDTWSPFTLDLLSGKVIGAIYPTEMASIVSRRTLRR